MEDDKRGAQVYYKLRLPCVLSFCDCVESVLKANMSQQQSLL